MATGTIKMVTPVENGGTNATSSVNARKNLEALGGINLNDGSALPVYSSSNKQGLKVTFSGVVIGMLVFNGGSSSRQGVYLVYGSTSTVSVTPILSASTVTVTAGTGDITIKCTASNTYCNFFGGTGLNTGRWAESTVTLE